MSWKRIFARSRALSASHESMTPSMVYSMLDQSNRLRGVLLHEMLRYLVEGVIASAKGALEEGPISGEGFRE